MSLLSIEEPAAPEPRAVWQGSHPLWALGFRPFYLMAAVFAALAMPLWSASYLGWLGGWPQVTVSWHMHEMVFGFAVAVVAGFLLTAVTAWTGLPTPRHGRLAALAGLWLAGRVAMLAAPGPLAAAVDMLFLPLVAWSLYRVLRQAGNTRNLFLVALLALLAIANGLFHAAMLGALDMAPASPIHGAILVIVLIESVIGTRVIPMFTRNGVPGSAPLVYPMLDRVSLGLVVAAALAWTIDLAPVLSAALAGAAACATLLRVGLWKPQRAVRFPLVWILHLSYAWIALGFGLLALASLQLVAPSTAFHALAVGSMAGLIVGMMTRTALGHTGRVLKAGRAETAMFWLIQAGAVARLAAAAGPAGWRDAALLAATLCWSLSFALYALVYAPYLLRPRLDGKQG